MVKQSNGADGAAEDVANVALGATITNPRWGSTARSAVYIGIQVAPTANLLDVVKGVRASLPGIQSQLPQGLTGQVIYDSTEFVNSSIHEVIRTLVEALFIVTLVVFLFLGSPALGR